ncbi:hypothetical protein PR048_027004 [Dryococelus australis]|uniref:Uncharacterized protein n=1 Tax=Dryococelus australis TaxID=614101 RepID=A0ABQ9GMY3_9NEOP|nr:hypothetical protein PR048_027004 [Dryococelus australis]
MLFRSIRHTSTVDSPQNPAVEWFATLRMFQHLGLPPTYSALIVGPPPADARSHQQLSHQAPDEHDRLPRGPPPEWPADGRLEGRRKTGDLRGNCIVQYDSHVPKFGRNLAGTPNRLALLLQCKGLLNVGGALDTHTLAGIRTQSLPHSRSVAHHPTAPREVGDSPCHRPPLHRGHVIGKRRIVGSVVRRKGGDSIFHICSRARREEPLNHDIKFGEACKARPAPASDGLLCGVVDGWLGPGLMPTAGTRYENGEISTKFSFLIFLAPRQVRHRRKVQMKSTFVGMSGLRLRQSDLAFHWPLPRFRHVGVVVSGSSGYCDSSLKRGPELRVSWSSLRVKRGDYGATPECKSGGRREIPEITRRPTTSPDTILTCENPPREILTEIEPKPEYRDFTAPTARCDNQRRWIMAANAECFLETKWFDGPCDVGVPIPSLAARGSGNGPCVRLAIAQCGRYLIGWAASWRLSYQSLTVHNASKIFFFAALQTTTESEPGRTCPEWNVGYIKSGVNLHVLLTAYLLRTVRRQLNKSFPGRWIGQGDPVARPGHLKNVVYAELVPDMQTLEQRVRVHCDAIRVQAGTSGRVRQSMTRQRDIFLEGFWETTRTAMAEAVEGSILAAPQPFPALKHWTVFFYVTTWTGFQSRHCLAVSEEIWAAPNIEVLKVDEGEVS